MVHPAEVVSGADAIAVAFDLHHVEHVGGFVRGGLVAEHAGEGQGVFVVGPAVHAFEVHHRGFDAIVHFQREIDVGSANHFAGGADRALTDGESAPVFALGLGNEGVKLRFALKDLAHRKPRLGGWWHCLLRHGAGDGGT